MDSALPITRHIYPVFRRPGYQRALSPEAEVRREFFKPRYTSRFQTELITSSFCHDYLVVHAEKMSNLPRVSQYSEAEFKRQPLILESDHAFQVINLDWEQREHLDVFCFKLTSVDRSGKPRSAGLGPKAVAALQKALEEYINSGLKMGSTARHMTFIARPLDHGLVGEISFRGKDEIKRPSAFTVPDVKRLAISAALYSPYLNIPSSFRDSTVTKVTVSPFDIKSKEPAEKVKRMLGPLNGYVFRMEPAVWAISDDGDQLTCKIEFLCHADRRAPFNFDAEDPVFPLEIRAEDEKLDEAEKAGLRTLKCLIRNWRLYFSQAARTALSYRQIAYNTIYNAPDQDTPPSFLGIITVKPSGSKRALNHPA